ncbi:hypothetical protein COT75_02270 [Candidatus Beckwithbacteria bacterium CG10_big_fil_rev_8_21_14_0_10_34_10]|uniref:PilN domain-containing protein n=1 Tax=Candidatus Beckwithbacteria bacterium CG10_big_fil_rev_8_21_14_0_10_34_10 TaxID=1974495 RepID=A0A2H0WBM9_9BACT|nr:MAG: hypothetical protein COT75_02270 [Candidatus Beckwithbacteria bacterium CG10_big_fil_rev_8_21_14_0_10_34_10]
MAAQKKSINFLLKESELEKNAFGKILKWSLNIGRYIVIFTELIVIIIFVLRFKLDQDLNDLRGEIEEKMAIVIASAELENEVRFVQKRLKSVSSIQNGETEFSSIINELTQLTPLEVVFDNLDLNENSVSFTGTSLSNAGLATLLSGLKSNDSFEKIDLGSVTSGGEKDPGLKFRITASLTK